MIRRNTATGEVEEVDTEFEDAKTATKRWLAETAQGKEFSEKYHTDASVAKLVEQIAFHDLTVDFHNLNFVFVSLRDSGQLLTKEQEAAAQRATEPDVPRDRNGKPLSASQLEWRQFAIWANDPKTSSAMIAERRRTSASFNKFYVESLKREFQQVGDAAEILDGSYSPTSTRGRL
jgi:hypothetical protein